MVVRILIVWILIIGILIILVLILIRILVIIILIVGILIIRRLIGTVCVILRRLGTDILCLAERENGIKNCREESHADAEARALAEVLRQTEVEPDLNHKNKHQKRQHQNNLNDSPDSHRHAPMIIAQNAFVVQTVLNSI